MTQRDDERMLDGTYRVRCMNCGKSVSTPLVEPVTVRAWVICPECIERDGIGGKPIEVGVVGERTP
jgi:DNA-directed RNA polymerase subunit RPC12/RpoP